MNKTMIALIPAYEPADTLGVLAEELYDRGLKTVIVDDGSGERFGEVFKAASGHAAVLKHESNRGKGRALKTGLSYIADTFGEDYSVVTLDADGQHKASDAVRVCGLAARLQHTLVLGCRSFGEGVPAKSRFGNKLTRQIYRLFTGTHVSDTQTGLRAFDSSLVPFMLEVGGERYEYEMNVLLECSKCRIPIGETEIETIYYDNNSASHFNSIKDSCRIYREIAMFALSSFVGFLTDYGMYSLLTVVTQGLGSSVSVPLSNVLARITSAAVNFSINKRFVFKTKDSTVKSGIQYFTLAACILCLNTVLLSFLIEVLSMNKYAAKLITEITFFTLSWLVQKFCIFCGEDTKFDNSLEHETVK